MFEKYKRNKLNLLEGIDYKYKEDGSVDWRSLIKPEFLVFNLSLKDEIEAKYGKPLEELNPLDVEDRYLLILLGGIKELAFIRGFKSVQFKPLSCSGDYISVGCSIKWMGNYETWFEDIEFEALGDASLTNTHSFASNYLAAIAENRAFTRCVRNFLRINIVGKDEIGPSKNKEQSYATEFSTGSGANEKTYPLTEPRGVLQNILNKRKVSFDGFKAGWIKLGNEDAANWNSLDDIPTEQIFSIIERISRKKKEKAN